MKRAVVGPLALAALLLSFHAPVQAEQGRTVRVTPSDLHGWSVVARKGTGDAAVGEFAKGYATPPIGNGSFHMKVGYSDKDPLSKVYLGTNDLSGIKLERITQFKLWACVIDNTYKRAQPVTVEIAVAKDKKKRLFTYYPWGYVAWGLYRKLQWREIDVMKTDGAWELTRTNNPDTRGDWAWLVKLYPGAWITTPKAADWSEGGTLPGTGINIKIGAGKSYDPGRDAWWWESCGCESYVDKLTIGYLDDSGREVITTYDFEPDSTPQAIP